jgi:hypothetical protein
MRLRHPHAESAAGPTLSGSRSRRREGSAPDRGRRGTHEQEDQRSALGPAPRSGFAILWDDSPGFYAYLEDVRADAAKINTLSISVVDNQPGDGPVQLMTKAMVGLGYSERSGGDR